MINYASLTTPPHARCISSLGKRRFGVLREASYYNSKVEAIAFAPASRSSRDRDCGVEDSPLEMRLSATVREFVAARLMKKKKKKKEKKEKGKTSRRNAL